MHANITIYTPPCFLRYLGGSVCLLNVALKTDLYHLVTILSPLQQEYIIVPATRVGFEQGFAFYDIFKGGQASAAHFRM